MSTNSLRDDILAFYTTALGHGGSVIALEREFFILSLGSGYNNSSWADCARAYYASWNGSNPAGSLMDEAFKYYASLSGLTPAANYSISDHMWYVFDVVGGPNRTPPNTDNLEAYYDASLPYGYQTDGRVSKNLLTYNQATVETDTSGFGINSNCTIARSLAQFSQGIASLALTSVAGGGMSAVTAAGGLLASVVVGKTYTGYVESKAATVTQQVRAEIRWYDAAQALLSTDLGSFTTNSTSVWTVHTATFVAPANAVYGAVIIRTNSTAGAGEVHYGDKFGLWEGTSTDWVAPGKLHNINKLTYNQATVETDTSGLLAGANTTIARTTALAASGLASLSLTAVGAGTVAATTTTGTGAPPVVVGKTYVACASVRTAVTGRAMRVGLRWFDSLGNYISDSWSSDTTDTSVGWTQVTVTAAAPALSAFVCLRVEANVSISAAEVHYVDQMGIWEGTSTVWVPPYQAPVDGTPLEFLRDLSGKQRHMSQAIIARQPLSRPTATPGKNILTYNQASIEFDTTGLVAHSNCVIAKSAVTSLHGLGSLQLTSNAGGDMSGGVSAGGKQPVLPDTQYTAVVSCLAASGAALRQCFANIWWYDSSSVFITSSPGNGTVTNSNGSWTQYTSTATSPANAAYALMLLTVKATAGAAEVHYIDCLGLWAGASTNWLPPTVARPSIQFDGADDYLRVTGLPVFPSVTVYSVARLNAFPTGSWRSLSLFGGAGVVDHYFDITTGVCRAKVGSATFLNAPTPKDAFTATRVVSTTYDGANGAGWVDGVALTPAAATGALGTSLDIGAAGGASNAPVEIMAAIVYSAVHTTQQRQQIERWLGAMYGATVA